MNNELEVWKDRIADRKASGLTVQEWCNKNHFTKAIYYYWHKKLNDAMGQSQEVPTFIEITPFSTCNETSSGIKICCKEVEISLTSKNDIALAVAFIQKLQQI